MSASAKQNVLLIHQRRFLCLILVLSAAFFVFAASARANSLDEAARALARKVSAVPRSYYPLSLVWQNLSSIPESESDAIRKIFEDELLKLGIALGPISNSARECEVSLTESPSELRLVARVPTTELYAIRIVSIPRSAFLAVPSSRARLAIQGERLLERSDAILGAAFLTSKGPQQGQLLVIGLSSVDLFREDKSSWTQVESVSLPGLQTPPRDLFVAMEMRGDRFHFRMGGLDCEGTPSMIGALRCSTFPVDSKTQHPYWPRSASLFERAKELFSTSGDVEATALRPPCRDDSLVVATKPGDWTVNDSLQLYEIRNREAIPVGSALDLSGPVLNLFADDTVAFATATLRNLYTGSYEVHRITLQCSN